MGYCIKVGSDEFAAGVFADTEGGVLDFVVVDVAVKADYYSSNLEEMWSQMGACVVQRVIMKYVQTIEFGIAA